MYWQELPANLAQISATGGKRVRYPTQYNVHTLYKHLAGSFWVLRQNLQQVAPSKEKPHTHSLPLPHLFYLYISGYPSENKGLLYLSATVGTCPAELFIFIFFADKNCVGLSFAYVAHFRFLREVWLDTNPESRVMRARLDINLAHPSQLNFGHPCLNSLASQKLSVSPRLMKLQPVFRMRIRKKGKKRRVLC